VLWMGRRLSWLGAAAAAAAASAAVETAAQECVCSSWDLGTPGLKWSGGASPGPVTAESVEVCQAKCCDANELGSCVAYSYDAHACTRGTCNMACTLWSTAPQYQTTVTGWTSGTLSAPPECGLLASLGGWAVVVALGGGTTLYFGCGILFKKLTAPRDLQTQAGGAGPDWLPHQQFWYSLAGLFIDGVMCCARCGRPNAPASVNKTDSLATAFLTSGDEMRRNSWASPPSSSATPSSSGVGMAAGGGRASTGSMGSPGRM
jgi:hypothetical protein